MRREIDVKKVIVVLLALLAVFGIGCAGKKEILKKETQKEEEIKLSPKKVGSRGTLFTFTDAFLTNVYVINGEKNVYIIDTYLGPDVMKSVNKYIAQNFGKKPVIVINTHHHWDHVWGNSVYASHTIIAHELCVKNMKETGEKVLKEQGHYQIGKVKQTYPNVTFDHRLYFEEDEVLIYHTPGHTDDSISIIDLHDKVLYAGDNIEDPKPMVDKKEVDQYIQTLEDYLELDVDYVIGGHSNCEDKKIIISNLEYVKSLK